MFDLHCLGHLLDSAFLEMFSHASLQGEQPPAPATLESFLTEMVANVVPQEPGGLQIFLTVRTAITERLLLVFLRVVALQVLQLEIADIRTELAGESLAGFQLVDRMLAENVLGQVPHQGETDLAESTDGDGLGNLLELETRLIDGKLILEFHDVAVLQDVVLLELVLSHKIFLTEFTKNWVNLLVIIRAAVVLIIIKWRGFLKFSLVMFFGNVIF